MKFIITIFLSFLLNSNFIWALEPQHALMAIPKEGTCDYFIHVRPLIIDMIFKSEEDALYPKSIGALAQVNRAWAKLVREYTNDYYSPEGKGALAHYRPHKNSNSGNSLILLEFAKTNNVTNKKAIKLLFNRLLHAGVDINAQQTFDKYTPLHLAASSGNTEIVQLLLLAGANKDTANIVWETPLHLAATNGHLEIVKLLLDAGAEKDSKGANANGCTPLHSAAAYGRTEIVKLILAAGADKDSKGIFGCTPLHFAAEDGHTKAVKLLLAASADKDSKNNDGWTPLHSAACEGHTEAVKLLLAAGAQINITNDEGEAPLDIAPNNEIKQLLLAHNAKKGKA